MMKKTNSKSGGRKRGSPYGLSKKTPHPKFKVGDKVKVKKYTVSVGGKILNLSGKTGIVTEVKIYDTCWYYVKIEDRVWAFLDTQLTLANTGSSWASEKI